MNISLIEDAINTLEDDDTTVDNVAKLASLYIVRANYKQVKNETVKELNEILPVYSKYIEAKKNYQLGKGSEELVCTYIKQVCSEIKDFLVTLYSGTDMWKERRCIRHMLADLYAKYLEEKP